MILFVLPAASIYDKQSRVMGWKATPASRDAIKELKTLVPRLRELGASRVIASDLDSQSAQVLGRRLNVPVEEWASLRRLNVGRWHGISLSKFEELYRTVQAVWNEKPDVPIKGGDSRTSFEKRILASHERLRKLRDCVVVADSLVIQSLTKAPAKLERGRIYQWPTP